MFIIDLSIPNFIKLCFIVWSSACRWTVRYTYYAFILLECVMVKSVDEKLHEFKMRRQNEGFKIPNLQYSLWGYNTPWRHNCHKVWSNRRLQFACFLGYLCFITIKHWMAAWFHMINWKEYGKKWLWPL